MKHFLLALLLSLSCLYGKAQWVSIPDSNFGKWLENNYPFCTIGDAKVGYQIDTTCNAILNATQLNCSYKFIQSIEGIKYFKSLNYLICSNNELSNLPSLPSLLTTLSFDNNQFFNFPIIPNLLRELDCANNKLTFLPTLPDSLKKLECSYNELNSLPSLPNSLTSLSCRNNQLTSLPSLPNSLSELYCSNNKINNFLSFPDTLIYIHCSGNALDSLPKLSSMVYQLYCSDNKLTSLPNLPSYLSRLSCSNNQLKSIPTLPSRQFYSLECSNNKITILPDLPSSLENLVCSSNQLKSLPLLPLGIRWLQCDSNANLSCLPNQMDSINALYISGTQISCMPNRFPCNQFDINPKSLPLCAPLSGCAFSSNIYGKVNQNTLSFCNYSGIGLSKIKFKLSLNGQVLKQTYAYNSGEYSFDTDLKTTYIVSIDTSGLPFALACPSYIYRTITLTNTDSVKSNQDFGLKCKGLDIEVKSIVSRFRPGTSRIVTISAGDIVNQYYNAFCASNVSGIATTTFKGPVKYVSPAQGALTPTSFSGNKLSYVVTDFSILAPNAFDIVLATDTQAIMGSTVCVNTTISTPVDDINFENNSLTQCFMVNNSYDPNAKEVYPTKISSNGDWLTYTVHFQNTGNDTAYDVVVRDTLDSWVDAETFQYLTSSNDKHIIQINGNAVAFSFPNINLPDSASNPTGSQGWFQYRVKTKKNLPTNTAINNTAFIYFDFNPAIKTNTATTNVAPLGITEITETATLQLYPNPNKGSFTLVAPHQIGQEWKVYDALGRTIANGILQHENEYIQLPNLSAGIYMVRCGNGQQRMITSP